MPITQVEVERSEPERLLAADKSIALDVRVTLASGERIDLEMQSQWHAALPERLLYYWARLYAGQLMRGEPYTELRRCAVILFADFDMLTGARFHSVFRVEGQHSRELLSPQLEVHVLELPKLPDAIDRNDEPNLTLWGKFLTATTDDELDSLAMQDPTLKQAKQALEELSDDPKARVQAEMREMALISYNLGLSAARRQGQAEGRAEGEVVGRVEGKAEMLRKLLTLKFGTLPEGVTQRIQRASESELERWLELAVPATRLDDVIDV